MWAQLLGQFFGPLPRVIFGDRRWQGEASGVLILFWEKTYGLPPSFRLSG